MTVATVDRPGTANVTEMGRTEAIEITSAIKNNFGSLGAMLLQARDRKAYKALGYRSFDTYCKTEFGKSVSSAYQLIEDTQVVAELEAEISKQYDEPVRLNFPSSHLRPLKELPGIGDKLKAIEYAQKLAATDGKKPTKKHLEIAVFQISGKKSDDFKSAIEGLGFTKGTQVEITKSLNQDRGFATKIDKKGKIYVELYNGGAVPIPYDVTDLRILSDSEKPAIPASDDTVNKGDKVKIFAKRWEGQTGEIFTWQMGKHAMVKLDGEKVPVNIAYAELEIIREEVITVNNASKWGDSDWISNNNHYYYFEKENKIISSSWPTGLTLEPYSQRFESPSEFMRQWEERFKPDLIRALTGNSDTTSEDGAKTDQIQSNALAISFSKTIDELVSGKKTQTRRAWQEDYAKNFIRYFEEGIAIPALNKGRHRGGHELGHIRLTQRPYQQYLSEMSPIDLQEEGGMVSTPQEFIDSFFEGQDKSVWVLHFEFEALSSTADTETLLKQENQRLREQLMEAEVAIQAMVDACHKAFESPPDILNQTAEFLVEGADCTALALDKLKADRDNLLVRIAEAQNRYTNIRKQEVEPLEERLIYLDSQLVETEKELRATKKELDITIEHSRQGFFQQEISKIALANATLQLRLEEAETVIKKITNADGAKTDQIQANALAIGLNQTADFLLENTPSTASPLDTAAHTDFLLESTLENSNPGDNTHDNWIDLLESLGFSQQANHQGVYVETYRSWDIRFESPNTAIKVVEIVHAKQGCFSCYADQFDDSLDNFDEIYEWTKTIINQIEDFCPGQLPLNLNTEVESFPQSLLTAISDKEQKIRAIINKKEYQCQSTKLTKREIAAISANNLQRLENSLQELRDFQELKIGQLVAKRFSPEVKGKITGLELSIGGMPVIWVAWVNEYGENRIAEQCSLEVLTILSLVEKEKE
jgi:hypothetical protein